MMAGVFLTRLALSLSLPALPLTIPPAYLALTGAVWGGLGLVVARGLFVGRRWARGATAALALAFVVWYWADRTLLVQTDYADRTWPSAAVASIVLLAGVGYLLTRSGTRRYLRRPNR
jgi:hypothetical protein